MTVLLYIVITLFCVCKINGRFFFHSSNESKSSSPNTIKPDSSQNISTPKIVSKSATDKTKSYEMPTQSLKAKTQKSPNQTLNTAQKTSLQLMSDFKSVKNSMSKSANTHTSKPTFTLNSKVPQKAQKTKPTNKPVSNSQILSTNSLQTPKKTILQNQNQEKYQKPTTKTINSSTLPYKDRSIRIPKSHQLKTTNSPSMTEIKSTKGSTKLSSKPTSRSWDIKSPKISISSKTHELSMTDSINTKNPLSYDTKEENNPEALTRKHKFTDTQKRKLSTETINSDSTIKSKEKTIHDYTRGKATYYTEWSSSPGSCGKIPSVKNIVALSPKYMKASCGKCISISYGTKVVKALVTDTCAGCSSEWIDLSDSLFRELAPLGNGVLKVGWSFTEC